ncbi:MAG: beta-lactamase family protein [Bacteroidia bacterium]|nr:serine hydrolase [Bacteroidia bacterium]MCZ2276556.1 beta-lactamase family protein [Bacteroidia bacterium]
MKKFINGFLIILVLLNAGLLLTGKFYYWKALVYNFVDIDDLNLFPYRTIENGKPQPWVLAAGYNQTEMTEKLKQELEDFESVAYLVIKEDSIILEKYWEGYSDSSYSNSFSMAKSVIGILTGIAIDEGKIRSINEPVGDFIEEFNTPPNNKITIYHLLTMSAELNWDESYSSLTSPTTEAYYGRELRKQMLRLRNAGPLGSNFNYQSSCTALLSFIIRKVTGQTVSDYASDKLWKPLGMQSEARWSLDHPGGDEKAYCCIYSNARDFARIGQLYLDSGRWNGKQIVSESYVLQSILPAKTIDNGKPNEVYGYHWWIGTFGGKHVYYARGILGQYIFVIPEEKMIIVRLGHKRDKDSEGNLRDAEIYISETIKMFVE